MIVQNQWAHLVFNSDLCRDRLYIYGGGLTYHFAPGINSGLVGLVIVLPLLMMQIAAYKKNQTSDLEQPHEEVLVDS